MSEVLVVPERIITQQEFEAVFKPLYGFYFPLALKMFLEYGPVLSFPSASVMLYAQEADKRKNCLRRMIAHFGDVISLCHPDLRGNAIFSKHPAYSETIHFLTGLVREFNPIHTG